MTPVHVAATAEANTKSPPTPKGIHDPVVSDAADWDGDGVIEVLVGSRWHTDGPVGCILATYEWDEATGGLVLDWVSEALYSTNCDQARFADIDGAWRVSLTPEFVALETLAYTSRGDFIGRMRTVLEAVDKHVEPAVVQRLGLRYIDRVTGEALGEIAALVRPEMLGIVHTPLARQARHELSETLLVLPGSGEWYDLTHY